VLEQAQQNAALGHEFVQAFGVRRDQPLEQAQPPWG
jgi:hypothetical protein